ncbi:MAG: C39 family peptidase [Candidatus Magasanikbacteria bacterium]
MEKKLSLLVLLCFYLVTPALASTSLNVPFTAQAPTGNWSQPWQDACEETVTTMVDHFYSNTSLYRSNAESEIMKFFRFKESLYGPSLDENAYKITTIINNYLPWEARIIEKPSLKDMKREIDEGRPIILPSDGKVLANPNFQGSGPPYHTIILKGYDDEKEEFITHDPGTQFGLDYRYSYDTILRAMHDFLPNGQTPFGRQVAIFTSPVLSESTNDDFDEDGLTKIEEIIYGSVIWLRDSDGDGYSDGLEVKHGYTPTQRGITRIDTSILLKSPSDPKVYLLREGIKRHIKNEEVFLGHGWKWSNIIMLQDETVDSIPTGAIINTY